jgi:hypothetical protein
MSKFNLTFFKKTILIRKLPSLLQCNSTCLSSYSNYFKLRCFSQAIKSSSWLVWLSCKYPISYISHKKIITLIIPSFISLINVHNLISNFYSFNHYFSYSKFLTRLILLMFNICLVMLMFLIRHHAMDQRFCINSHVNNICLYCVTIWFLN